MTPAPTVAPATPRAPRLTIFFKSVFQQPFAPSHVRFGPYQAIARCCERVDVIVVSDRREGHEEVQGNLHLHAAPYRPGWRGHVAYVRYACRVLADLARTAPPDIYWADDPLTAGLMGWWAHRRYRAPWVVAVRGDARRLNPVRWSRFSRWSQLFLTRTLTRRADRVRVVAARLKEDMVGWGVPAERVVVLPSPTDVSLFDPLVHARAGAAIRAGWGWDAAACAVVFMGTFNRTKGLDMLLEAAAAAHREAPHLRLVLLGDGGLRGELEAQRDRLGLQDVVLMPGWVGHDEVPGYLAAADGLVLSSRDEGLPRCAVEAAAMARPVVITDVGGCAEVVLDEASGYLVQPTVEGLAAGLLRLAQLAPAERAAMGRRGREHVLHGRFEATANQQVAIDELLRAPLAEHPRRAR